MSEKWSEEKIIQDIKNRILLGELQENSKISERKMLEEYKVSRSCVRIAISHLEKEEWLYVKPKSGTYVAPIDPDTIRWFIQLRLLLEPQMIIWNISKFTAEDISRMERNCQIMDASSGIEYEYAELDNHNTIKERTENKIAAMLLDNMTQSILRITSKSSQNKSRRVVSVFEWRKIISCIKRKDADNAGKYMIMHLLNSQNEFWKYYSAIDSNQEEVK